MSVFFFARYFTVGIEPPGSAGIDSENSKRKCSASEHSGSYSSTEQYSSATAESSEKCSGSYYFAGRSYSTLSYFSWESPKRVIGKQCTPRSDPAFCGI